MSLKRFAAKRDANEDAIVDALEAVGAKVERLSGVSGLPDLLVGWRGANWLLEVKAPGGKLTDDQRAFLARWLGTAAVVSTPGEALAAIGAMVLA